LSLRGLTQLPIHHVAITHLRRLFPDPTGIDDEFERIRVLVLLHQLEVDESFGVSYRAAAIKPVPGRLNKRSCEFVFAVGGQAFHCLDQLSFRQTEVIDQKVCAVGAAEMLEAL
jgi:hypothetical protein